MTPSQFYAMYNGRQVDTDNYPKSQPYQCVDGWKVFCRELGVPVKATPNNYADGYWYSKDELGYGKYFEYITDYKTFKDGDWVIWAQGSGSHPYSHIAMYYQGMSFGENQGGNHGFSLKGTVFYDALGALRWKGYAHMELPKGYSQQTWNGIQVDAVRASADKGYSLHLISAEDGQPTGTSRALKDLLQFDSDRLGIVAAVNANYFDNQSGGQTFGMHFGCEGDGHVQGYWQAPKTAGIISYYIAMDGQIGAHDESSFYLAQDDIQLVCAPYSVLIHDGQNVELHSTAYGSKELYRTNQTAAFRINQDWCLAIFSECYPSDVHKYAQELGANELILMDSGGSTQMFECSTTGHRRAVRDTGRLLPNVLVLAQTINPAATPDLPEDPQEEPKTEPIIEEPVQSPEPVVETPVKEGIMLSNKMYDVLKVICTVVLPAVIVLLSSLADIWSLPYGDKIISTLAAINVFIGALIGISSNAYWKAEKGE